MNRLTSIRLLAACVGLLMTGCGVTSAKAAGDETLVGADETATSDRELSGTLPVGTKLTTTAALNLRSGPSTSYSVRTVMPKGASVTVVNGTPSGSFYNVQYGSLVGWASGKYLEAGSGGGTSPARTAAINRAKGGVGYSYWWGHARWVPGSSSSKAGSCSGSCPSCTHSGSYGADCSGYVGKVWEVPTGNDDPNVDSHPYSTATFYGSSSLWSTVDRGAVKPGDALVYRSGSSGHIFLFESGDGWGSMWAYEAKGCSTGIVRDLRTATSSYKAIARTGY